MTLYKDPKIRRELIMKHYSNPNNKGDVSSFKKIIDHYSSQCVDEIHLGINIVNNIIKDVEFEGLGCAVFLSSVDIMLDMVKGQKIKDAKIIISNYENMINNNGKWDKTLIGPLAIYENVASHLNRLDCAKMISDTLNKVID